MQDAGLLVAILDGMLENISIWAQTNPMDCKQTNVDALKVTLYDAIRNNKALKRTTHGANISYAVAYSQMLCEVLFRVDILNHIPSAFINNSQGNFYISCDLSKNQVKNNNLMNRYFFFHIIVLSPDHFIIIENSVGHTQNTKEQREVLDKLIHFKNQLVFYAANKVPIFCLAVVEAVHRAERCRLHA